MVPRDDPLHAITKTRFIPLNRFQEPLQRPRRRVGGQRHRLDALAGQVRQLPSDVRAQVTPRLAAPKTIVELVQKTRQLDTQPLNPLGVHATSPPKPMTWKTYRRRKPHHLSLSGAVVLGGVAWSSAAPPC